VSNELVHGVDVFPTLAKICGGKVPDERPFDGLDMTAFFTGKTTKSPREGLLIWCADRLHAAKWRNWKLHFYEQDTMFSPPLRLPTPFVFDLYRDPREEKPTADSWVVHPMLRMVAAFDKSTREHPLIPMGAPDPYTPPK
jgi:arylsulfatase